MAPLFGLLALLIGVVGAVPFPPDKDASGTRTDEKYFITNRYYKQAEAFDVCRERGDLWLVRIQNTTKSEEVHDFLSRKEFRNAWTAGQAGRQDFVSYKWGEMGGPITEFFWQTKPSVDNIPPVIWRESGVVVVTNPPETWLFQHRETLHPALSRHFAEIDRLRHHLAKKDASFRWESPEEKAFQLVKLAMISVQVLDYFYPEANIRVVTNASN
ncbi:unnamed protein product [Allacma fusca]|uniref:Uncharacterized protein n=1 Tax=Allacma fusca TaxID=39272 RepID=A0A8J2KXM7_9HEXA|nr:unnamed protein product [Allacma fusca]